MYINSKLFSLKVKPTAYSLYKSNNWMRPYDIWSHCREILFNDESELHRVDALLALKRCYDIRLKQLKTLYNFNNFPIRFNSKHFIDQLGEIEIVRPLLLQKIRVERNFIEHEDETPPTIERCLEYLDIVWYFLKSTDRLAQKTASNLESDDEDDEIDNLLPYCFYSYEISINPDWEINFSGWVKSNDLSEKKKSNWIETKYSKLKPFEEVVPSKNRKKHPCTSTDFWIEGCIVGPESFLRLILRKYFQDSI